MPHPQLIETLPLPPRDLAAPPAYRQPVLTGTYSHTADRSIEASDVSMTYYLGAPHGSDLTYGFDRRRERDDSVEEHLDGLCEAMERARLDEGVDMERRGGVVTWRGMLTRIMTAPFEYRDGWEMQLVALDGSVYMELYDPPEQREAKRQDESSYALQSYMGYSFEAFSTVPHPGERGDLQPDCPPGWSGDVNTNVQWCNIVRSAIGDIPICIGGEVDCVKAEPGASNPGLAACVELKTNKVIENDRQDQTFHKKLLKHWAQSFLLGVPMIEVGFRTDTGILKSRTEFETAKIPGLVGASAGPGGPPWHPVPCLHFLYAVLEMVMRNVLPSDPLAGSSTVAGNLNGLPPAAPWRLRFTPRRGCELFRCPEVKADGRWGGILPEGYVRSRLGLAYDSTEQ